MPLTFPPFPSPNPGQGAHYFNQFEGGFNTLLIFADELKKLPCIKPRLRILLPI